MQTSSIRVLNIHWIAVVVTPVRLYMGSVLDMYAQLQNALALQAKMMRSDSDGTKVSIQQDVSFFLAFVDDSEGFSIA